MPNIRPSSDLRNKYNEISLMCHEADDAIYITKNGCGDLAVMSIEAYEALTEKVDLYRKIEKGFKEIEEGKFRDAKEILKELESRL